MTDFNDPADLCGAWAEVERTMPEGWYLRSLLQRSGTSDRKWERKAVEVHGPHWRATAARRHDLGMRPAGMMAIGPTAAAALWRLADYLTKVGPRGWSETFGDPTFAVADADR